MTLMSLISSIQYLISGNWHLKQILYYCKMQIEQSVQLKHYNTFGIDAQAKNFASFASLQDLEEILSSEYFLRNKSMILGGGSNLLFTKDFDGLVLKNDLKGIELVKEDEAYYYVKAWGGEVWHEFVLYCLANNFAGVENLSLIPGCVGASPMQNIGAYGVEIKDIFHELEAFHLHEKSIHQFTLADCAFGYRESVFKNKLKDKFVILNVTYRLRKEPVFNTSYGAITQELEKMGIEQLTIQAVSQAVINIRTSKLPDPKQIGNAGSFFKNPVVEKEQYKSLVTRYPSIVGYNIDGGAMIKLAAGWLIEQCGWKGYRKGDAGVHSKQALVLVNYGNAKGSEIFDLSCSIIESVDKKFGVKLDREVNII